MLTTIGSRRSSDSAVQTVRIGNTSNWRGSTLNDYSARHLL